MANATTVKNKLVRDYGYYDQNMNLTMIRRIIKCSNEIDEKNKLNKLNKKK